MKRPEGFDERPERPAAPAPDAPAERPRRGFGDRFRRRTPATPGQEARPESVPESASGDPASGGPAFGDPASGGPASGGPASGGPASGGPDVARSPRDLPDLPDVTGVDVTEVDVTEVDVTEVDVTEVDVTEVDVTGVDVTRIDATRIDDGDDEVRAVRTGAHGDDEVRAVLGGAAGSARRRFGAGLSSVAGRLRELSPDEDYRDPDAPVARTATGLLDPDRASRTDTDHDEVPLGAGVRAAETAREARVARKRRRLVERAEIRRFTRRSRHRRAAWLTAGSVLVVLVLAIVVAVYSPLMALTRIQITGTSRIDEASVQRALDDQLGTPLARVDFSEIKRELAGFPLIESYVTEEAPPHTLVVTITEREPIVAVKTASGFDLVDPAGIVVESDPNKPDGMPVAAIDPSALGSSVYRSMTEVVLALPSTVRTTVTEVTATTADDVTLTLDSGAKVVWGSPDDSDAKATLLAALIKDHDARDPSTAVEYDVSAPDNGIIRQQ